MKRQMSWALLAGGIALAASTVSAVPVAAASGSETFKGTIVTSGVSGTRTVLSSVIIFKGVFNGVGRIVETESRAGDPPGSSRDDLVFPGGTIHLLSTAPNGMPIVHPDSCTLSGTAQQSAQIDGGTGQFADATGSFTGTVSIQALLPRNPDGSCAAPFVQPSLHEVDMLAASGTLSF